MLSVLHKMSFMLSVHMLIDINAECMLYVIMLNIVLYDAIMQNVDKQDVITVNVTDYSKLQYSVECFCSFVFMV